MDIVVSKIWEKSLSFTVFWNGPVLNLIQPTQEVFPDEELFRILTARKFGARVKIRQSRGWWGGSGNGLPANPRILNNVH